jgi:hypothetical protein
MATESNMTKRKGSANWYYREAVPQDARDMLLSQGKKAPFEVWRSLGTGEHRAAKLKLIEVRSKQHDEWKLLRSPILGMPLYPNRDTLQKLITETAFEKFVANQREGLKPLIKAGTDLGPEIDRWKQSQRRSEFNVNEDEIPRIASLLDALCRQHGWQLSPTDYEWCCQQIEEALSKGREHMLALLEGRPISRVKVGTFGTAQTDRAKEDNPSETLTSLFELYAEKSLKYLRNTSATLDVKRKIIAQFSSFVGERRSARSISKQDVRKWG